MFYYVFLVYCIYHISISCPHLTFSRILCILPSRLSTIITECDQSISYCLYINCTSVFVIEIIKIYKKKQTPTMRIKVEIDLKSFRDVCLRTYVKSFEYGYIRTNVLAKVIIMHIVQKKYIYIYC